MNGSTNAGLRRGLQQHVDAIDKTQDRGKARRVAEGAKDAGQIAVSFRVIAGLIERFMVRPTYRMYESIYLFYL